MMSSCAWQNLGTVMWMYQNWEASNMSYKDLENILGEYNITKGFQK